ncbi:MAG: cytochrome P460 family protein [Burkholderiales bacterium]|jgi:cytochrome c553|nr:cytochrome P460 family protein [Burkholderiales bacterium]
MKYPVSLIALALAAPLAQAADLAAGKAKVETVCAACHGANGASVGDAIPNLAGQKSVYLENQLKALKDGSRKHQVMGAIAAQLSADDIANVAAFFAAQPGAAGTAKSAFLPNLAKTGVSFPEGYRDTFTWYHTINFPATKQVRYYYANPAAMKAAKEGKDLPNGAYLFAEVYSTKLDADKNPIKGSNGFFVADQLLFYTAMARDSGWGQDIPALLRNDEWNYAVFTGAKQHRPGVNQAECLACHKPLDKVSYTFTLKELATVANAK